jgi:hypothetical protein
MANATNALRSLERGADNLSLDGVNSGVAAGDVGVTYALVAYAGRGVLDNWLGLQIDISGSPTGVLVTLLGSIDGVNYYTIQTYNATTGGLYFVSGFTARFVRTVLTTLTGGTAPAVTTHLTQ